MAMSASFGSVYWGALHYYVCESLKVMFKVF